MKKIMCILLLLVMSGCMIDTAPPTYRIYNYSDEAVYVYQIFGNVDSLPLKPKLVLFCGDGTRYTDKLGNRIFSPISQREYRIDAYNIGYFWVGGRGREPKFQEGVTEITLFFITEKTMREYSWKEIYEGQRYESRVVLTEGELKDKCWRYTYQPKYNSSLSFELTNKK